MAEQHMTKPSKPRATADPARSRPTAVKAGRSESLGAAALSVAVERLEAKVLDLKGERDALATELAAAKAEIAALDAARKDAINRIDWVIDSLHTALKDKS
jgi:outer membrane murein-binding lipoprotein Lpp